MKLQIKVNDQGIIEDVKFKTFGCGSAIASSSYMTERVLGMTLDEAGAIKNTEIAKELSLPPVKLHCSSKSLTAPHLHWHPPIPSDADLTRLILPVLAEDAIKAAIKDYRKKRAASLASASTLAEQVAGANARSEITV